ncbi:hypothetical protein GPECTOR_25g302 [Gonium pectorale]|uniref:Putative gamma-glutamylcyclotransferase n=1 Tax=Gonium pectorale TaxID=33097 RepID=A0A150GH75_GONPE|nr:hypothetical protein GPECTOR_25g302 [Gonium pectorale]|eukprot:KXZ48720.1 hypothetical protein GPECTOR_25g302 [Gonium pectorale]
MPGNAFVYGTLMADEVVRLLIKRVPASKPAVLKGYTRYKVKGQVFPAIVPSKDARVEGKVLLDLSDKELHVLDVYEAEEYYRATVTPVLEDGTELTADVYVWKDQYSHNLNPEPWSYDEWREKHLSAWVSRLNPDGAHPEGDM